MSAGGPKLSCSYQGTLDTLTLRRRFSQEEPAMEKKRAIKMEKVTMITPTPTQTMAALMKRNVTTDVPSLPSVTYQPNYTYSTSASSGITYVPMTWNTSDGGTVTLTTTLTTVSLSVLTTEIVFTSATAASSSASPSSTPSTDGTCGPAHNGMTCTGSSFGNCCSSSGYCGSSGAYCGTGCQSAFGTCSASSPDGTCGGTNGYVCTGSTFGNCCNTSGSCGSDSTYCGVGCQAAFGTCDAISPDGTCAGTNGYICQGSAFGDCCSSSNYCGSTSIYCGTGCQTSFGTCT